MSSTSTSNIVDGILAGLGISGLSSPYTGPTPPLLLQPSTDGILATLTPTDAHVFRSALAGIPLISDAPPLLTQFLTPLAYTPPFLAAPHTKLLELGWAIEAGHAKATREDPVACYALFMRTGGILGRLGCFDDTRYAARAALRFTKEELDDEMSRAIVAGTQSWETFKPLVSYRLACTAALTPLIELGPPPAEVVRGYAWTWRTCPNCVVHIQHGPGDACGVLCREAPWFVEFWKELVATLRASPDPDAVLGVQHISQALQGAVACPTCSRVAFEHLRCFQGLLIVEAAKRIAEVSFAL
uniref:Structural maintenance of chromosomes protein n=1 Tax=Ganoderma boninense TaxID=34458 RepID=A0A5K1K8B2_9APHY|nr:Structural maintenance of chromosomes protein [Ganoderma boninense]